MAARLGMTVLFSLFILACGGTTPELPEGLTSLKLTISGGRGSESDRLPATTPRQLSVRIAALDEQGRELPGYSGKLRFAAKTGLIDCEESVEMEVANGDTITLNLTNGLGDVRIMAEDMDSYVVGVSEIIYMEEADLETLQRPFDDMPGTSCEAEDHREWDRSPWAETFIRITRGKLIVTGASLSGFYATDVCGDEYNHVYVYSFSNPGVEVGDWLAWVSGVVNEYWGLTEISHDNLELESTGNKLPCPVTLTADMLNDEKVMERLEGALVWMDDLYPLTVMDSYGQWQGGLEKTRKIVTVLSKYTAPGFDPEDYTNEAVDVVGNLRQHYVANPEWIISPRDSNDIYTNGDRDENCQAPDYGCR